MIALSCTNITKSYGIECILDQVSFTVNSGDKIGLIGVNGAGKTTLMKILMGIESKDSGDIFIAKDTTIGYLEQNTTLQIEKTAFDYCEEIFSEIYKIESRMRELELLMGKTNEASHFDEYSKLQELFDSSNGYSISSKIKGVLKGLGFSEEEYLKPIIQLSGGQKSRVGVARLLLKQPDILLLDEPTNHLDIDAICWLENYLKEYNGTIILISHDRYFLDKVTNRIFEIEATALTEYSGNYSQFIAQKKFAYEAALKQFEKQQVEIQKQEALIRSFKERGTEKLAKRAKSREKRMDHIEIIDKPKLFKEHFKINLQSSVKSGRDVLKAEGISKIYDSRTIFDSISFDIYRGEKIGLIGPNGVGKTTLFKLLLGYIPPDSGTIIYGHNIEKGYYDQELSNLTLNHTILEEIHNEIPELTLTEVRNLLGAFLFKGDDYEKMISNLSGGERSRVSLLKLMLSASNFLLLDEPTNHLDIMSKETLEDALINYEGTVLTISHDRYFLNKICSKIFELRPTEIITYWGNYDYYLEKQNKADIAEDYQPEITKTKQKELLRKEKEKKQQLKHQRETLAKLEQLIHHAEEKLHNLQLSLSNEEIFSSSEKSQLVQKQISNLEADIEKYYDELDKELQGIPS